MNILAQLNQNTNSQTAGESSRETLDKAWQYVIAQLKHEMGQSAFDAYLRDSRAVELKGNVLTVASPTVLARDWSNSRLLTLASRQMAPLMGHPVQVHFIFSPSGGHEVDQQQTVDIPLTEKESDILSGGCELPEDDYEADEPECQNVILEVAADSIETALVQPGRIIAFPRYELRFIPLVGPENFFLRLAFLQERYFHTRDDNRDMPFETSVESLLRWANVGRATLHRFKKGDSGRGQMPAAGWFGITQLPSTARSSTTQQQPPCRYKIQAGIPLTPIDADDLRSALVNAGIQSDPVQALKTICERPIQNILQFPAPPPNEALRGRMPTFTTVAGVVKSALEGTRVSPAQKTEIEAYTAKLSDHITMPQQMVHVSWYFLQEWLPILGHDAAAMVLYTRAQGFYNPQTNELRDEVSILGGYRELARVIGLKRDRTIGDWLPNIFESQSRAETKAGTSTDAGKWAREQQRLAQIQHNINQFLQIVPGSRVKTAAGHFAFSLRVEIKGEPLTPADQLLQTWVQTLLAGCAEASVIEHFLFWVKSDTLEKLAHSLAHTNDGAGILGESQGQKPNDGWGILGARREYQQQYAASQMTAGESGMLADDGWGILEAILNDSSGILGASEMTAGERFKRLLRLNTYWDTILNQYKTTEIQDKKEMVVADQWDLKTICRRNGGMNAYREKILAQYNASQNDATIHFLSWLFYACGPKGRGINDPVGWALSRLKENQNGFAEGAYARLAAMPPPKIASLLRRHIESGMAPTDTNWSMAFYDAQLARLRELEDILGLSRK